MAWKKLTSYDGHLVPIAAEAMDIVLHPLQRKVLVEQPGVGDTTLRLERRAAEEAKGTEPVVERHVDDAITAVFLADLDEAAGIAAVMVVLLAGGERTAMNPGNGISSAHKDKGNVTTYQTTTGALAFRLLYTALGTTTSKNKQSSVTAGLGWAYTAGIPACLTNSST